METITGCNLPELDCLLIPGGCSCDTGGAAAELAGVLPGRREGRARKGSQSPGAPDLVRRAEMGLPRGRGGCPGVAGAARGAVADVQAASAACLYLGHQRKRFLPGGLLQWGAKGTGGDRGGAGVEQQMSLASPFFYCALLVLPLCCCLPPARSPWKGWDAGR